MIGPKGEMKVTPSENLMILGFYHSLITWIFPYCSGDFFLVIKQTSC
jgi:hypothetical protein